MKVSWLTRGGWPNGMAEEGIEAIEGSMMDTVRMALRKKRKVAREVEEQQRSTRGKKMSTCNLNYGI